MKTRMKNAPLNVNFLRSLPTTAAALGNKFGVKVVVGGFDCCTDGTEIRLPASSTRLAEDELLGYLAHEAAHIRFTTFGAEGSTWPLRHEIVNALEDVRIENELAGIYPGAGGLLIGCHEKSIEELLKSHEKVAANPAASLALHCLSRGHSIWTKLDCVEPLLAITSEALERHFGADLKRAIDKEIDALPGSQSTRDVVAIADRIIGRLRQAAGTSPNACGQSADSRSGEAGKKGAKAGGSPSAEGKPSFFPQLDAACEVNAGTSGTEQAAQAAQAALEAKAEQFDRRMDISSRYGEEIAREAQKERKEGSLPQIDMTQLVKSVQSASRKGAGGANERDESLGTAAGDELIAQALEDSSRARRVLRGIVKAKSRTGSWTARSGRRVSSGSAARLAVWNTRVFERRTESVSVDTALHVLLDMSGSMKGKQAGMAVRASLALTAALMSIRHVNPALSAFSGRSVFMPIVPHGARSLAPFAKRIGVLKARGSTPLTEALFGAAIALSCTKENKKAVLVLTDGEPNDPWSVASVMKRLRASGIRTYGLGIGVQLDADLFDIRASIDAIEELEAAILNIGRQIALEANGTL